LQPRQIGLSQYILVICGAMIRNIRPITTHAVHPYTLVTNICGGLIHNMIWFLSLIGIGQWQLRDVDQQFLCTNGVGLALLRWDVLRWRVVT
tara:strand:- start:308 stop:583 length:276 start_codon:yes stop_codon:yes gene_type:complete